MAGREKSGESAKGAGRGAHPELTDADIVESEKATMENVSRTISALEVAMAEWDALTKKPDDLAAKMEHYKKVHEALADWQIRAARSFESDSREARVRLLWEFVDLCHAYLGGS